MVTQDWGIVKSVIDWIMILKILALLSVTENPIALNYVSET